MKTTKRIVSTLAALGVVMSGAWRASAETPTVDLPPFHEQATKLVPAGKLGQVLRQERQLRPPVLPLMFGDRPLFSIFLLQCRQRAS